jgi:hypothetical protein
MTFVLVTIVALCVASWVFAGFCYEEEKERKPGEKKKRPRASGSDEKERRSRQKP